MRDRLRAACRPLSRAQTRSRRSPHAAHHAGARLRPGTRFWSRSPNHARVARILVRRILKFHQSDPLLEPGTSRFLSRKPMLHSEPPQSGNVQPGTDVPTATSSSVPRPRTAPSTAASDRSKIENRSDFGQFWTGFVPNSSSEGAASSEPQTLWSPQPGEPPADYQLFAAWLQLTPPRRSRNAAAALGCSVHRLRRLCARYRWKTRAAAFDRRRASSVALALDQLLRDETSDWRGRAERFRLQEWLLHEQMLQAASDAIAQLRKHPRRASLSDIVKLHELAFALGRRACGMPLDPPPAARPEPPPRRPDVQAALRKIYGSAGDAQGESVP